MRPGPPPGYRHLSLSGLFALALIAGFAGGATGADAPGALFESDAPLAITLEGPFADIAADSAEEPGYREALMRLDGAAIPLRIRARGKHRRKPAVCQFPPLRLNFDKASVADTVFAGQNKLKMVTHCQRPRGFQQYLLREYLAYRLYNLVSDYSFRVRLLEVAYIDTKATGRDLTRFAFLIEDNEHMAERNDAEVVRVASAGIGELDPAEANLVELFQYMIGNTDWSSIRGPEGDTCCHNTELIATQSGRFIPVPYDFDNSGLVDTPYARPSTELPVSRVTERLYRGFCRPAEVVAASVGRFAAQRNAMLALIDGQPGLGRWGASNMTRYLERFFVIVGDESKRERTIERECR